MLTALFYLLSLLLCTTFLILSTVAFLLCAPFDPARRVVHALSRIMVKLFFAVPPFWRRSVEGMENVDPSKRYVVVMNHTSMLDIPMLYLLPLNFRWVSKREVFNLPFFGQFLLLHGDIVIERGNGAQAMEQLLREGCDWIKRGASVAIFPEGTRSKSGKIGRFKMGAFNLAQEAQVEILPVVIDGAADLLRKRGLFNWRCHLTLKVLPPVALESGDYHQTREVVDRLHEDMSSALEEMREIKRAKKEKK